MVTIAKSKVNEWLTEDGLIKITAWARDGLTNEQIAHNMGINPDTLYEYKKKYPEINDALKRGKEVTDIIAENMLYQNAIGFEYEEENIVTCKEVIYKDGKRVKEITKPQIVTIKKRKLPETTALIFWLKNRKPKVWRDKQELEHSGNVNNPFEGLTTDELRELIKNGYNTGS